MGHKCAACKCEIDHEQNDGEQQTPPAPPLPDGWFIRCIDDTDYTLCDVCGAQIHFRGGISPYLMDCLELMDDAVCDVSQDVALAVRRRRSTLKDLQSLKK